MSDEKIDIDLDPKKVLGALDDMAKEMKNLASKIEESLGKDAPKSIKKLEDAAENGTNRISKYFRDLGKTIKEDLKSAFDVGSIASGLKIGKEFADGTKQVFEMERAFDRLNTRLQMTGKQLADFKKNLGSGIASTGQKLEDILPGVETAAAKGGIKNPGELSSIGEALAKARGITGEETGALSDTVVEILKNQGQKITAESFKQTLDALQGTRVSGAFKTAGEAGNAINELAPYGQKLGLSTRELGGLAAQASQAGPAGQDILRQLMEKGTSIGGREQLNAVLGQNIFGKNGKLNAEALGKVDQKRFGPLSQQVLEQTTGLTGASGADLSRFLNQFKGGLDNMNKVVSGANETGAQFEGASDNLATSFDKFKEKTKEAGREIGGSISKFGGDLLHGKFGNLAGDTKGIFGSLGDNAGTVAGGLGLGALAAVLVGKGSKNLLSKIPGGGMLEGLAGGEAAKAAGITPVYVTNASEIGGSGLGGKGIFDALKGAGGKIATAGAGLAGLAAPVATGAVGFGIGVLIGNAINDAIDNYQVRSAGREAIGANAGKFNEKYGATLTPEQYYKAVKDGTIEAYTHVNKDKVIHLTSPSEVTGRGPKR